MKDLQQKVKMLGDRLQLARIEKNRVQREAKAGFPGDILQQTKHCQKAVQAWIDALNLYDQANTELSQLEQKQRQEFAGITPTQVAAYAYNDSRALMEVHADDLLRELTYRMGYDVREVVKEAHEKAMQAIVDMTLEQRSDYYNTKGDILLITDGHPVDGYATLQKNIRAEHKLV